MIRKSIHISPYLCILKRFSTSTIEKEGEVMKRLRKIVEPITGRTIAEIGFLQNVKVYDDKVTIKFDTIVPGYPEYDKIISSCKNSLSDLPWLSSDSLQFNKSSTSSIAPLSPSSSHALGRISQIIGISSCKGGVGKSTISANLAAALAQKGLKVGLLDADVYGPSLPMIIPAQSNEVKRSAKYYDKNFILPLQSKHLPSLKILSFGHVNPKSGAPGSGGKSAALVRGPIATKIITQLLMSTEWGELDYLLIDMPPGTGDIQITLSQSAQFSGAMVVSTPHPLALIDAAKGVDMFNTVNIPVLGLIENMSYFESSDNKKHYIFGKGEENFFRKSLHLCSSHDHSNCSHNHPETDPSSIPYYKLPICNEQVYTENEDGSPTDSSIHSDRENLLNNVTLPIVISHPESKNSKIYHDIADGMIKKLFKLQTDAIMTPSIQLDQKSNALKLRYFTSSEAFEYILTSDDLLSRHPDSGQKLDVPHKPDEILSIDLKGQYGVGVTWKNQGTKLIYPYDVLMKIAKEK